MGLTVDPVLGDAMHPVSEPMGSTQSFWVQIGSGS